jgi:hypothetical protein
MMGDGNICPRCAAYQREVQQLRNAGNRLASVLRELRRTHLGADELEFWEATGRTIFSPSGGHLPHDTQ